MANSGFRGTSTVLMVVAVAAVGGFLYWVYSQAQSLEREVQPTMADTAQAGAAGRVTLEALARDPGAVVGRTATLDSVEVAGSLGRGVFTLALNDTLSYPVLMASELIQRGATVYGGDRVLVQGRFYTLNDSIKSEWISRGAVNEDSRGRIPEVASFLLADSLDIQS